MSVFWLPAGPSKRKRDMDNAGEEVCLFGQIVLLFHVVAVS